MPEPGVTKPLARRARAFVLDVRACEMSGIAVLLDTRH